MENLVFRPNCLIHSIILQKVYVVFDLMSSFKKKILTSFVLLTKYAVQGSVEDPDLDPVKDLDPDTYTGCFLFPSFQCSRMYGTVQ